MATRLLLVTLCALLAVPGGHALSCYQCSDAFSASSAESADHPLLKAVNSDVTLPPCSEFSSDEDRFKTTCSTPTDQSCSKVILYGRTVRGCFGEREEGCKVTDTLTECFCSGDHCNAAGLAAPALLLLLLPAALLASLYTV